MRKITKGTKLTEREKAIRKVSRTLNEYMDCVNSDRRRGYYGSMHEMHIDICNSKAKELRWLNSITDEEYLRWLREDKSE